MLLFVNYSEFMLTSFFQKHLSKIKKAANFVFVVFSLVYICLLIQMVFSFSLFKLSAPGTFKAEMTLFTIIPLTLIYLLILLSGYAGEATKRIRQFSAIIFIAAISICFFVYPYISQDPSTNLFLVKTFVRFHENPYVVAPVNFPEDPWLVHIPYWHEMPMHHGPLSVYIYSIPLLLTDNYYAALTILRLLSVAALIACVFVAKKIFERLGLSKIFENRLTYLILVNPFIVLNTVAAVHNDIFVALLILLFVQFLLNKKYLFALIACVLAGLIKYVPFVLGFVVLVYLWKDSVLTTRKKITVSLIGLVMSAILVIAMYTPFVLDCAQPDCVLTGLRMQFTYYSLRMMLLPTFILYGLGLEKDYLKLLSYAASVVLAIYFAYKQKLRTAVIAPLMLPVFFANTWFLPWYVFWVLFISIDVNLFVGGVLLLALLLATYGISPLDLSLYVTAIYLFGGIITWLWKRIHG